MNVGYKQDIEVYNKIWEREVKSIFKDVSENVNHLETLNLGLEVIQPVISQGRFFLLYINELFNGEVLKVPRGGIQKIEVEE